MKGKRVERRGVEDGEEGREERGRGWRMKGKRVERRSVEDGG